MSDVLKQLADATDQALLEIASTGRMRGRDSEGNEIETPVSAMMWGQIIRRLKDCNLTRDLTSVDSNDGIAGKIAKALQESGGRLPALSDLPDAATG